MIQQLIFLIHTTFSSATERSNIDINIDPSYSNGQLQAVNGFGVGPSRFSHLIDPPLRQTITLLTLLLVLVFDREHSINNMQNNNFLRKKAFRGI